MAFKLTKSDLQRRGDLAGEMNALRDALNEKIDELRGKIEGEVEDIKTARDELNEKIQEANEWQRDVASEHRSNFEEKSERWQQGDRGQAVEEWIGELEAELDEADVDEVVEMCFDNCDCTAGEDIENKADACEA